METYYGRPLKGRHLSRVRAFLKELGLEWDEETQVTITLEEDGEILATGSRQFQVLKCIGVIPDRRGEGLAASLVSLLIRDGIEAGYGHLFLYTRPSSTPFFRELGFYEVAVTEEAALMENRRDGIVKFVQEIRRPSTGNQIGAIVANCNPFTIGHRYLAEQAAQQCDFLYFLVVSEQRSRFPAEVRLALARAGTAHIPHIFVCPTGNYLISTATFPTYFIKDRQRIPEISCLLDLEIFARHFAGPLKISRRFIGSEPFCPVTRAYHRQMKMFLPEHGVEVVEIPRYEFAHRAISASDVRMLLDAGRLEELRPLVPAETYHYLEGVSTDGVG